MSASQNNATLTLVQQDSVGTTIFNRTVGPVMFAGSVGVPTVGVLPTVDPVQLELPVPVVLQFYIKNTSATAVIAIYGGVPDGDALLLKNLQPGSVFLAWDAVASVSAGYTSLAMQASAPNTSFEMFIGG